MDGVIRIDSSSSWSLYSPIYGIVPVQDLNGDLLELITTPFW